MIAACQRCRGASWSRNKADNSARAGESRSIKRRSVLLNAHTRERRCPSVGAYSIPGQVTVVTTAGHYTNEQANEGRGAEVLFVLAGESVPPHRPYHPTTPSVPVRTRTRTHTRTYTTVEDDGKRRCSHMMMIRTHPKHVLAMNTVLRRVCNPLVPPIFHRK